MSFTIDRAAHHERPRSRHGLPSIGAWWPMLERTLQSEVLANPDAPLRTSLLRRIYDLCDLGNEPLPRGSIRLGVNERAYIAGWRHAVDWT